MSDETRYTLTRCDFPTDPATVDALARLDDARWDLMRRVMQIQDEHFLVANAEADGPACVFAPEIVLVSDDGTRIAGVYAGPARVVPGRFGEDGEG